MEKIAIIGLSCLLPDAETPTQFWQNLLDEKRSISEASIAQMGADPAVFYQPGKGQTAGTGKHYCNQGGFIQNFQFDPTGYAIAPDLLQSLDVSHQWSMYVAREALRDSGYWGKPVLEKCGVILGSLALSTRSSQRLISPIYQQVLSAGVEDLLNQPFQLPSLPSSEDLSLLNVLTTGYPSAVVAQALAIAGVNFTFDGACSSPLYAVRMACQYLQTGKADLMLAGSVSAADPLLVHTLFSLFQAHSADGNALPLDEASSGLLTGEGAGMLALKRYSDAVRDGDRIYATILGVGLSNDGRGKHTLSPNPKGQIVAYERAYAEADLDPKQVAYVECHGTGTPLGDRTEMDTLEAFFGQHGAQPKVGSVKSNVGHLLTAAGMPSLLKVILSLKEGVIPPTINVKNPISSENGVIGGDQIVRTLTPFPSEGDRHAAVSAFGFGGTNAHLILQSAQATPVAPVPPVPLAKMAIVGMDAFFGQCRDLDDFERCIYNGTQQFIALPEDRWQGIDRQSEILQAADLPNHEAPLGAYIAEFEFDHLQFKIPPNAEDPLIPQQLLLMNVAEKAIQDANLAEGANVAVIAAMGTDLGIHQLRAKSDLLWQVEEGLKQAGVDLTPDKQAQLIEILQGSLDEHPWQVNCCISFIGNTLASRISAQWDFSGPSFALAAEENSVFKAMEVAQLLLSEGTVDAVVIGAVDLAGSAENVLLRHQLASLNTGTATLGFDEHSQGWMVGEGAGAVVLKRLDKAESQKIYAVIDAVSVVREAAEETIALPTPPQPSGVIKAATQAFQQAGFSPSEITYLEVHGSGIPAEDAAEIEGLLHVYGRANDPNSTELSCAIGSIKANIGHTFAASGMASLIKTALCLYHSNIAPTPRWSAPKQPDLWAGSPFYVPTQQRPWYAADLAAPRKAAISGLGIDRSYAHILLSETPQLERQTRCLEQTTFYLFPLAFQDLDSLEAQLNALQETVEHSHSLAAVATQTFNRFQNTDAYSLVLLGHSHKEIIQEIGRARSGIPKSLKQGTEWKTPVGSYFTPKPLGKTGEVAFVYPGGFTSYLGAGRDIMRLFPHLLKISLRLWGSKVGQEVLYRGNRRFFPRSLEALSVRQLEAIETSIMDDAAAMLTFGTVLSTAYASILQEGFKVQPKAAFGYSLGELSMMVAGDVWPDVGALAASAEESAVFKTRIAGPKNAVREFWGLPDSAEDADPDFWATHVVMTDALKVIEAVQAETHVYITHINTPKEIVIAGDSAGCDRVIQRLQCDSFRAPASHALHCAAMASEYQDFCQQFRHPVQSSDIRFYSSASYDRVPLDATTISQRIAQALCQPVDFPRLIRQAYDDGARIFVEMGAGGTCTRWIRENLKDEDHISLPMNTRGIDDHTSLLRALAKLVSHQVSLDLSPLYPQPQPDQGRSLIKTVTLGGKDIKAAITTAANRQRFIDDRSLEDRSPNDRSPEVHPVSAVFRHWLADAAKRRQPRPPKPLIPAHPMEKTPVAAGLTPVTLPAIAAPVSQGIPQGNPQGILQDIALPLTSTLQVHATFLQSRQTALLEMSHLIETQIQTARQWLEHEPSEMIAPEPQVQVSVGRLDDWLPVSPTQPFTPTPYTHPSERRKATIFDEADLLEHAQGKLAHVFGESYSEVDTYPHRVRVPMPPYLFLDRVTALEATRGKYEPCLIETEYDVPIDAWYLYRNQSAPAPLVLEFTQGNILLTSYLGLDSEVKGKRFFRALGGAATFVGELPKGGDTVRNVNKITRFVPSGESFIYFYTCESYVGDRIFLKLEATAGFFTAEELGSGQGVTPTAKEKLERSQIQPRHFQPLLPCAKTQFTTADLVQLYQGDLAACFGAAHASPLGTPDVPSPQLRMIDRITVDPTGGAWGLGLITAEKDLEPEHWYFNCHFKDDYCVPGTLNGEGCSQTLLFYALYLGLHSRVPSATMQPIANLQQSGRHRGQVAPAKATITYQIEVTDIGVSPTPYIQAEAKTIYNGKVISFTKGVGVQFVPGA